MRHGILFSDLHTRLVEVGRIEAPRLAQKVERRNEAVTALAEAQDAGDPERIRLATEALSHHDLLLDASILEMHSGFKSAENESRLQELTTTIIELTHEQRAVLDKTG